MRKMMNKLRSNVGESITEVLVALAIGSLALLLLANMVQSSVNIITKSKIAYNSYIEELNVLTEEDSQEKTGTGTLTFNGNEYNVDYFVYEFGDSDIISFKR